MVNSKVISAEEAVRLIKDGASLVIQGSGGGVAEPTLLMKTLGERYRKEGHPRGLTVVHSTGLGDKKEIGMDYLAQEGLVKRDIAGHLGMAPAMGKLILENKVEAYNFPQGVLSHMYSAVAAKTPGVITKVGLHTYIDPRLEGGKMNEITKEDLVKVIQLEGEEWLFWPRFHFDVAFVRGTTADTKGNITMEEEGAFLEATTIAQAAKNCGGIVIAQVKYLAQAGTLNPHLVKIPGIYVDYIVVDPEQKQTAIDFYNPAFCGHVKVPLERIPPIPLDERKVIARRAAKELFPGAVVNLGVGLPSGIASVATEEGFIDQFTLTVEQGPIGGTPVGGVTFGVAYNPEAIIPMDAQFRFYDGGGLDVAFLGMAQTDREGNVNSSKVGGMLAGCGGFINITQNAKKVVFCGTFTAKDFQCQVGGGKLHILSEGKVKKFVQAVHQITFSGKYARTKHQKVLYITERAVFSLEEDGVHLLEIAPGIDLEQDVISQMEFKPVIDPNLRTMDKEIFQ
ncbi:MAG: acyl CoA:acetate/3-ketoacid CoA transferase [Spirochaetes bacterium]|nr:acyl CoA:acetate/3-ketoacid CoA transferase [Spirochaetota bacterium]